MGAKSSKPAAGASVAASEPAVKAKACVCAPPAFPNALRVPFPARSPCPPRALFPLRRSRGCCAAPDPADKRGFLPDRQRKCRDCFGCMLFLALCAFRVANGCGFFAAAAALTLPSFSVVFFFFNAAQGPACSSLATLALRMGALTP